MNNQSELEHELMAFKSEDGMYVLTSLTTPATLFTLVDYITASYTPIATVEQLKSRIAWLEGKIEGLTEGVENEQG